MEESIYLAVDTGIDDITLTEDFNYDMQNYHSAININSQCEQFPFYRSIYEPTYFTEH